MMARMQWEKERLSGKNPDLKQERSKIWYRFQRALIRVMNMRMTKMMKIQEYPQFQFPKQQLDQNCNQKKNKNNTKKGI